MELINSDNAPTAVGPYSHAAVDAQGTIYVSGCLPMKADGDLVEGSIAQKTDAALSNLESVLKMAGSDKSKVLKTTIFLVDLGQFAEVNEAYADFFAGHKPARSCVQVSALPKGVDIEIEAIAQAG